MAQESLGLPVCITLLCRAAAPVDHEGAPAQGSRASAGRQGAGGGPGTGYYALHVAEWLEPGGTLDVLDLQQAMLDHVMRRGQECGIENIVPTRGDARILPYPEGSFDAAYLTVVLGEIPDQEQALQELHRVLKPGGRLVVGEVFLDFHMIPFGTLRERAEVAGLSFKRWLGGPLGYFASFRA